MYASAVLQALKIRCDIEREVLEILSRGIPAAGDQWGERIDVAAAHEDVECEGTPALAAFAKAAGGGLHITLASVKATDVAALSAKGVDVEGLIWCLECGSVTNFEVICPMVCRFRRRNVSD